jgi:hypothetical protein
MSDDKYYIKPGDTITVAGMYRKRIFWQWLTRKPKELFKFTVGDDFTADIT